MKIISTPYTSKHSLKALRRIHKTIIRGAMNLTELQKLYSAMLHLERYVERLTIQNGQSGKQRSGKSK
ncbi:MAG: hypothetical protein ACN6NI_07360 [Acinetobacter sp.]